jgi:hypothetical protein
MKNRPRENIEPRPLEGELKRRIENAFDRHENLIGARLAALLYCNQGHGFHVAQLASMLRRGDKAHRIGRDLSFGFDSRLPMADVFALRSCREEAKRIFKLIEADINLGFDDQAAVR